MKIIVLRESKGRGGEGGIARARSGVLGADHFLIFGGKSSMTANLMFLPSSLLLEHSLIFDIQLVFLSATVVGCSSTQDVGKFYSKTSFEKLGTSCRQVLEKKHIQVLR